MPPMWPKEHFKPVSELPDSLMYSFNMYRHDMLLKLHGSDTALVVQSIHWRLQLVSTWNIWYTFSNTTETNFGIKKTV